MVNIRCHNCGIPLQIKISRLKRLKNGKISCSRECASILKKSLYSGDKNPNFKYKKNLEFIYNFSHDGAYMLGLIWADGSIHKNTIQLSQNDKISGGLLKSISYRIFGLDKTKKRKNLSILEITDKKIIDFILSLGGINKGKKSDTIELPNISKDVIWSFLCGYFDGDGSFKYNYKYPEISITSNSSKMLNQISKIWGVDYKSGSDKIYASGYKALDICGKMYQNVTLRHLKKYEYFMDILNWEPLSSGPWLKEKYFKCKRLSKDAILPTKNRVTDIGYDLYGVEVTYKKEFDLYLLDTKIAVQPIPGYYFDVVGRSSLPKKGFIFAGGVGIIDPGYIGSIKMYLKKIRNDVEMDFPFKAGQLILRKAVHVIPVEVDGLQNTDRGNQGFGSTDNIGGTY